MPALRFCSTHRSLAAVVLVVSLLVSFGSVVAWAAWDGARDEVATPLERFAEAERPSGSPAPLASEPAAVVEVVEASGGDVEPPAGEVVVGPPEGELSGAPPVLADVAPPAPASTRTEVDARRDLRVQEALDRWMAEHPEAGAVAVGVAGTGVAGYRWGGAADGEGTQALDHEAAYPILSVTKTFTEALVLREASKGRIDLDAAMPPIEGVAAPPDGVVITPRMLLQHSSGLVNYMDATGYDPAAPMTPQRAVSLSLGTPLLAEPGTAAHYSNSNFHWLGLLVEQVSGRSFGDLVADLAASYDLPSTSLDPFARPGWVGFASGGMRSTLGDVAHWGAQLFAPGIVLEPEVLAAYRSVGPLGVGLGLWPICPCTTAADGEVDYRAIGQIVADGGMLYFPAEDVVVAVRLRSVPGDVGTATASLAGALVDALVVDGPDEVR